MRTLVATLTALMLFATTPVVVGDFEDGLAAYRAGDYQKALRLWKPVAEQGNKLRSPYLVWNGLNEPRIRILRLI